MLWPSQHVQRSDWTSFVFVFCFCFSLCDRQHSSSGHKAYHRPRMCAAGHTPHPLCGAVRRPRVRLQPIRILEAFAGRDVRSVPSERLTQPVCAQRTPPWAPLRATGTVILVTDGAGPALWVSAPGGLGHRPYPPGRRQDAIGVSAVSYTHLTLPTTVSV